MGTTWARYRLIRNDQVVMPLWQDWRAPAISAGVTAALFSGAALLQSARGGWPFERRQELVTPTATPRVERVPIEVSPRDISRLGIQIVVAKTEAIVSPITTVATVSLDESRLSHVHTRVAGWVEQLNVNTTGEYVRAGQPVARIFSQELLSSQAEYLAARRFAASGLATSVVSSGRMRLRVLGMTDGQIRALERSGQPIRLITVTAPTSGIVVNRGVSVGTAVDPSTELLTLANMANTWVFAEVPETEIRAVRAGTPVKLDFPSVGLAAVPGKVVFVYPTLSERTRTLRVRISAPNWSGLMIPGLYGTATFDVAGGRGIVIPRDAVIDTGRRQHVFVAQGGMFEPRPVALGPRLGDRVVIREGLAEGERVVASGTFLLDSESRLRATGGGAHSHGSMPMPTESKSAPAASGSDGEHGTSAR
jgi:Cu(I)/Ag(I) efflux system membrane fusion protein